MEVFSGVEIKNETLCSGKNWQNMSSDSYMFSEDFMYQLPATSEVAVTGSSQEGLLIVLCKGRSG